MSSWNDALTDFQKEVAQEQQHGQKVGEKAAWAKFLYPRIKAVADYSGIPFVVYATACTSSARQVPPGGLQIDVSDKLGFHEVISRLKGTALDLLIHSPGGSPEAAESIVEAIRSKFSHVRIFVPSYAKSAATMMALSADEIVLDSDAELGPIDPQMMTANGYSPAEAIKDQFLKAGEEITKDPKKLSVWIPILQQMGPSLLVQCDNAIALSKTLVRQWLARFMFSSDPDAEAKANAVAEYLGQHSNFKSHGRSIRRSDLRAQNLGLKLVDLEKDKDLYDRVWAVYFGIDVTFGSTGIFKMFYNSHDEAVIRAQALPTIVTSRPMMPQKHSSLLE